MDYWHPKQEPTPDERRAFEKARLDYCSGLYSKEMQRKELLEKKAQFYLSLVTLFIGALFLRLDFLKSLQAIIAQQPVPHSLVWTVYASVPAVGIAILVALIAILQAIAIQQYLDPAPSQIVDELFSPTATCEDELGLFEETALMYAIALESNRKVNNKKARWVKIASYSAIGAVVCLAILLGTSSYLFIYF